MLALEAAGRALPSSSWDKLPRVAMVMAGGGVLGAARPIETGLISRGCQWGEVIEDKRQAVQREREKEEEGKKGEQ